MSNNHRNKKRRMRASDEQENAITITEREFETDGVLTRSAAKKSRKNKAVTFHREESSEDGSENGSEKDQLESDEEPSQQQDNNNDDLNHENQETQTQPNETPQQDSEDFEDEYQPKETPQQHPISLDSSNDESQPEETLQQENGSDDGSDEGNQRYIENEGHENSENSDGLNAVEEELIQLFQLRYPGDESYRECLNRMKREIAPHRKRKAREPWSPFETFVIEMRLTQHDDNTRWIGIMKDCPHIFSNRTNVQIKDKARTELKRRQAADLPLGEFEFLTKH